MHPSEDNVQIQPENEYCQSNHMTIFVSSIYAYKGLLMVIYFFILTTITSTLFSMDDHLTQICIEQCTIHSFKFTLKNIWDEWEMMAVVLYECMLGRCCF